MKKISVIVPGYNAQKYVERCMKSLEEQTIGMDGVEIILVDDGSSDKTLDEMKKWEEKYSENVLLIHCENNGGLSAARNLGMSYASGKYIAFVDMDDDVAPEYLERMYQIAEAEQSDMVLCRHIGGADKFEKCTDSMENVVTYDCRSIPTRKQFLLSHIGATTVWGKLFRSDFVAKAQLVFPEGTCYEDTLFTYTAYMQAECISECPEALYRYYRNEGSITVSGNEQRERNRLITLRMFYGECVKHGWDVTYAEELCVLFVRKYYGEMLEVMFRKFETVDYALYCQMRDWICSIFPAIETNTYLREKEYEIIQFYLKIVYNDLNAQQLQEMRKVFLWNIYQIDRPQITAPKTYRYSSYPVKEEFFALLEEAKSAEDKTKYGELLQEALSCVPLYAKESEIAAFCSDFSIFEKVEYYQYVIDRECVLSFLQDEWRRKKQERNKTKNDAWITFCDEMLCKICG